MNLEKELDNVVDYIKSGLKPTNTISEIEDENIIQFDSKIDEKSFFVFDTIEGDNKIATVDGGSSIVLNAGSFIIGIYQAGYLIYQKNRKVEEYSPKLQIKLISFQNKDEIYNQEHFKMIGEYPNKSVTEINWLVQRLRIFEEWKRVQELIEKLDSGDIIIYDGALKADIALPDKLLLNITKKAYDKGVILIGLSKRSTLYSNHVPITYTVKKYGEKLYPDEKWFFEVSNVKRNHMFGKTFIVKFNPISNFVFRTDINIFEKEEPRIIFGKISNYCNDPSYLGYPYPLAFIHNKVVIDSDIIKTIKNKLQTIAFKKGISYNDWESLFLNFHDVLDRSF